VPAEHELKAAFSQVGDVLRLKENEVVAEQHHIKSAQVLGSTS